MTYERDYYTLSVTGRRFYANRGIVGIDPDGEISEGYDGGIDLVGTFADVAENDQDRRNLSEWTKEERAELAAEMVRRWEAFGAA